MNNAGVGDQASFDRSDWERTRQVLRTNVFAVAHLTALMRTDLARNGGGGLPDLPRSCAQRIRQLCGTVGGMAGGLPPFLRISAARCAKDAIAGAEVSRHAAARLVAP